MLNMIGILITAKLIAMYVSNSSISTSRPAYEWTPHKAGHHGLTLTLFNKTGPKVFI